MKTFKLFIAVLSISFFFSQSSFAQSFKKAVTGTTQFTVNNGAWDVTKHVRKLADVNGDGRADIIGFGSNIVMVALAKSDGTFSSLKTGYDYFTYNKGGIRLNKHVLEVADVNGDGRADIVCFGENYVFTALGKSDGTFAKHKIAYDYFTYNKGGIRPYKHVLKVNDVNGDGRADIVCFGENFVFTALGKSDGTFAQHKNAYDYFTYNKGGIRLSKHVLDVADVNGDGRADIVCFGENFVFTALGQRDGTFAQHKNAYDYFTYNKGGIRLNKHILDVADVNDDGRADIVCFGENYVFTALGQSDGTFAKHKTVYKGFTYNQGNWRVNEHPREVADVNGDGKADIIGFGNNKVVVAIAQ